MIKISKDFSITSDGWNNFILVDTRTVKGKRRYYSNIKALSRGIVEVMAMDELSKKETLNLSHDAVMDDLVVKVTS